MKSVAIFLVVGVILILAFSSLAYGGVPQMINYQGKITDPQGALVDTTIKMVFSIYDDSTSGNILWADTLGSVAAQKGIFSVLLGSGNPIPDSVFDGNVRYLGVKVGADSEMTPRKAIVSVGYAYKSEHADTAQYAYTAPAMADADWVINGDTIYHVPGNVGIGTISPEYKLHVNGGGGAGPWATFVGGGSVYENVALRLRDTGSDNSNKMDIEFTHYTDPANARIRSIIQSNEAASGADLVLETTSDNSGTFNTNQLYLDNSGNVGIGTTSPTQKLDVAGTAQMTGFKMPTGSTNGYVLTSDASGVGTWQTASGGIGGSGTVNYIPKFLGSTTLGNSVMYETGGNVGIGTMSPGCDLEIADSQHSIRFLDGNQFLTERSSDDMYPIWWMSYKSRGSPSLKVIVNNGDVVTGFIGRGWDGDSWSNVADIKMKIDGTPGNNDMPGKIEFSTTPDGQSNTQIRLTIKNNGNVGIGTADPGYKLDVNGDFYSSTVNTGCGDNELYAMNQNVRDNDNVTFNRVHLDDYGTALDGFHVGGTSDPGTDNLVVDGNAYVSNDLVVHGLTEIDQYLSHFGDPNTYILFTDDQLALYSGSVNLINALEGTQDRVVINEYSVDVDFRVESDYDTSSFFVRGSDGNVGIGTADPGYKLDVNGDFYSSTVNTGCGDNELYAMNQNVRDNDNVTFNNVEAGDFDYSTAQTRYYSLAPSDFIPGNPDADDVYYFRDDITVQSGSATFLAPVHLPHGAVIKEVCVWFENTSEVWDFHRVDHSSGATDLIFHASPGCQSLTHTVDNINYSYQIRTYTHEAGDEIYGGRVKYEVVNPLP